MKVRATFGCALGLLVMAIFVQGLTMQALLAGPAGQAVDSDKVYCGDAKTYQKPGTVRGADVYKQIPEYQRIIDLNLTREDPEYWVLATRASQKFHAAIARAALGAGLDLVAEAGAIRGGDKTPPDVTGLAIRMLKENAES